jgi:hypothetical protein
MQDRGREYCPVDACAHGLKAPTADINKALKDKEMRLCGRKFLWRVEVNITRPTWDKWLSSIRCEGSLYPRAFGM